MKADGRSLTSTIAAFSIESSPRVMPCVMINNDAVLF